MSQISLLQLLDLVGELKDDSTPGNASERFRKYLRNSIQKVEEVRAYIDEALGQSGEQFNKALQDLINHVGQLLGFEVTYGRYRGVRGENGFDGLWRSQTGWSIVVETKTTDAYSIKTAILLGYINSLISEGQIKDIDKVLGLYVYGRYDTQTSQLENTIIAEKRRDSLRVIGVEALLNLLELKQKYSLSHEVVLSLFLPAPVRIDSMVNLIFDIVVEGIEQTEELENCKDYILRQQESYQKEELADTRIKQARISQDYTGKTIRAFTFQNQTYPVSYWSDLMTELHNILAEKDRKRFEEIVPSKNYISTSKDKMRRPKAIRGTPYFLEANFSANSTARLCYALVESMGYDQSDLILDVV